MWKKWHYYYLGFIYQLVNYALCIIKLYLKLLVWVQLKTIKQSQCQFPQKRWSISILNWCNNKDCSKIRGRCILCRIAGPSTNSIYWKKKNWKRFSIEKKRSLNKLKDTFLLRCCSLYLFPRKKQLRGNFLIRKMFGAKKFFISLFSCQSHTDLSKTQFNLQLKAQQRLLVKRHFKNLQNRLRRINSTFHLMQYDVITEYLNIWYKRWMNGKVVY